MSGDAVTLSITVSGAGLLCAAGINEDGLEGGTPGKVPGFKPRKHVPDRKSLKLMTRSVALGVSAVRMALERCPSWDRYPPERRGLFVGASPQPGDPEDLRLAMERSMEGGTFSVRRFAEAGYPVIHPLWLLRGLSNNVLGFASAAYDFQGVNANYCDGEHGGWRALLEGAHAVAEGRCDLALAGGAESLIGAEALLQRPCGEGDAFVVFERGASDAAPLVLDPKALDVAEAQLGYLGAARWPVAFTRSILHPPQN